MNSGMKTSSLGSVTMVIGAIFTVLVMTGKLTSDQSSMLQNAIISTIPGIITIGGFIWSLLPHRDASVVLAASKVPGVHPLQVDISPDSLAPLAVQAVAANRSIPSVQAVSS